MKRSDTRRAAHRHPIVDEYLVTLTCRDDIVAPVFEIGKIQLELVSSVRIPIWRITITQARKITIPQARSLTALHKGEKHGEGGGNRAAKHASPAGHGPGWGARLLPLRALWFLRLVITLR